VSSDDPGTAYDSAPQQGAVTRYNGKSVIEIAGGRVTTLDVAGSGAVRVEITTPPVHGNATVNPDNSIALVLSGSDYSGPLSLGYTITRADGTTESATATFNVAAPTQQAGWGQGLHYMLEEDASGDLIVETGENHRKVYVSENDSALSRADIAALERLPESSITRAWLLQHPEYGGSEGMAVSTEVGIDIWKGITSPHLNQTESHWLLFERGYTYENTGNLISARLNGESELHPVHITSWGEGARPVLTDKMTFLNHEISNVVISNLVMTGGVLSTTGKNIIFHDMLFTDEGLNIQYGDRITLHDSAVTHVVNAPNPGQAYWSGTKAGLFTNATSGWLIEGTIFHHNGWEDDYHMDWSTEGGMPPNMFSHNVYLQNDTTDVTFRNNITAEASSFGAHIRGGGYVENNLFLDNNNAVDFLGGIYAGDGPIGNFTLFADNVITSGAHKQTDRFIGGLTRGVTNEAHDTTLIGNIIAHLANPDDPDEIAAKRHTNYALNNTREAAYDDTIIYNWKGGDPARVERAFGVFRDTNIERVDPDLADLTTIQRFAAQLMGEETASIRDLMTYLTALPETAHDDAVTAKDIVAWFQQGFGMDARPDGAATDHRFVPNALADGIRWDNRLNWTSNDVPDHGDNVDLGGNWVHYGARTTGIEDLDLGSGGRLHVTSGRLTVEGTLETGARGGLITVEGAGQFWTDGYAGTSRLTLDIDGGRFANIGHVSGTISVSASGGQTILATDGAVFDLGRDSELRIEGAKAKVGFDGAEDSTAVLRMSEGAILTFKGDAGGFSTLTEFRSGHWDQDGSPVKSGVLLDGLLQIDLAGHAGGVGSYKLIAVDTIAGAFEGVNIHGLDGRFDATVYVDYERDELRLDLGKGSGQVEVKMIGDAWDGSDEDAGLWAALTANQGTHDETLPRILVVDDDLPDLPDLLDIA